MEDNNIINISDISDDTLIFEDDTVVFVEKNNNVNKTDELIEIEDTLINIKDENETDDDIEIKNTVIRKRKRSSMLISSSKRLKPTLHLATSTPIKFQGGCMVDKGLSPIVFSAKKDSNEHKCTDNGTECGCKMFSNYVKQMEEMSKEIQKLKEDKIPKEKKNLSVVFEEPEDEKNEVFHTSVINDSKQFISENIHFEGRFRNKGLRPIVIDGSNIAFSHTKGRYFSVRGLKICIDFFLMRGHKVYAFIPSYRLKKNQTDNQKLLMSLVDRKLIFCTSSRELFGRKVCSYDDRILVQVASAMKAVIVSSDNFRDLLKEEPRLRPAIERGLLVPTWVDDLIIFPSDPLGRNGPSLRRFLEYPVPH